jgi:hypothetical protein
MASEQQEAIDFDTFSIEGTEDELESEPTEAVEDLEEMKILQTVNLIKPVNAKSFVWKYFGKYPATFEKKMTKVVCRLCRELSLTNENITPRIWELTYGLSKSTSKLSSHLRNKHPRVYADETTRKVKTERESIAITV